MREYLIDWLPSNPILVVFISIGLNILVAVSGLLPSTFVTAANIIIFEFQFGLIVSIIGEAVGAVVSFLLYRKGINKFSTRNNIKNKFLKKLQYTKGMDAILLVILLRVLPFVPSGIVTFTAAYSKMGFFSFFISSTLGKIPSLYIEAYSLNHVLKYATEWQFFIIIVILLIYFLYLLWKRKKVQQT